MFMAVTGVVVCVGECLADALLANAQRERWGWVSLDMTHAGLVLFFVFSNAAGEKKFVADNGNKCALWVIATVTVDELLSV